MLFFEKHVFSKARVLNVKKCSKDEYDRVSSLSDSEEENVQKQIEQILITKRSCLKRTNFKDKQNIFSSPSKSDDDNVQGHVK